MTLAPAATRHGRHLRAFRVQTERSHFAGALRGRRSAEALHDRCTEVGVGWVEASPPSLPPTLHSLRFEIWGPTRHQRRPRRSRARPTRRGSALPHPRAVSCPINGSPSLDMHLESPFAAQGLQPMQPLQTLSMLPAIGVHHPQQRTRLHPMTAPTSFAILHAIPVTPLPHSATARQSLPHFHVISTTVAYSDAYSLGRGPRVPILGFRLPTFLPPFLPLRAPWAPS